MHELSIMSSIMQIVQEEMQKHNKQKLNSIIVVYGALTNIVPDSLDFAFEALTKGTDSAEAKLVLEELPLVFTCGSCKKDFSPENKSFFEPCPYCSEVLGHNLVQGRELYIKSIDVED